MSDEDTTALIPEAPVTEDAAPTEAPAPDPYEKRYNDLRSDYDRRNTLLDRARQGDVEAIRALGFDYEEPEADLTPDEDEDPYAPKLAEYEKKISELEQWKQAQEAERTAASIRNHVDTLAKEQGLELTDTDREYIFRGAVSGERIGAEETAAAFKSHVDYLKERFAASPQPPSRPGTGQAVEKQPDLDDPQERRAWMKAQLGL